MTLYRFIVSFIYALAGFSAFVALMILKNYPSAILGAVTGILSAILCHLHLLNHRKKLNEWYTKRQLDQMGSLGFYSIAFCAAALVYYSIIEIMLGKPIFPIPDSAVLSIVWSFMAVKSGAFLTFFCYHYSNQQDNAARILSEEIAETQSHEQDELAASIHC